MFSYKWKLSDLDSVEKNGLKVFSCFSCGGGSSMGYKMAGFDVVGNVEIDKRVNECYVENLNPKHNYCMDIRDFVKLNEYPDDLYNLDILDGSPPCSSFSMAGNREKDWGKEKKFREGQKSQTLDDLFFEFIDLAEKLKPKVVIAENVKGLLQGEAWKYVEAIYKSFDEAGYAVTHRLLDASDMGVPQKRERVFFVAIRKDLPYKTADLFGDEPFLDLQFNEEKIPFSAFDTDENYKDHPPSIFKYWKMLGDESGQLSKVHEKGSFFSEIKINPNEPLPTITAGGTMHHHKYPRRLCKKEFVNGGSYAEDYNFMSQKPYYLIGMSVPPLMTYKIVMRIKEQLLT